MLLWKSYTFQIKSVDPGDYFVFTSEVTEFCCEFFSFGTYKAVAPQTFWPWNTNIYIQT